jgi:hypothetical protein
MKAYKKKLRVLADVECSGIWEIEPPAIPEARHIPLDYDELNLPQELVDKFDAWIESYEQYIYDRNHFNLEKFNKTGKQIAKELKTFLGKDYYVEYEAEAEPHVRNGEEIV